MNDNINLIEEIFDDVFKGSCETPTLSNLLGDISGFEDVVFDYPDFVSVAFGSIIYSHIIYNNISKLYPEYNYGSIDIRYNPITDSFSSTFDHFHKSNSIYFFINVAIYSDKLYQYISDDLTETQIKNLGDEDKFGHSIAIFINMDSLTAEYFIPDNSEESTHNSRHMNQYIETVLNNNIHPDINLVSLGEYCIYPGPQIATEDNFCQTWSLEYLFLKLNLPDVPVNDFYNYLGRMDTLSLESHVTKFMRCLFWKITRPEERFIIACLWLSDKRDIDVYIDLYDLVPEISHLKVDDILKQVENSIRESLSDYIYFNNTEYLLHAYETTKIFLKILRRL